MRCHRRCVVQVLVVDLRRPEAPSKAAVLASQCSDDSQAAAPSTQAPPPVGSAEHGSGVGAPIAHHASVGLPGLLSAAGAVGVSSWRVGGDGRGGGGGGGGGGGAALPAAALTAGLEPLTNGVRQQCVSFATPATHAAGTAVPASVATTSEQPPVELGSRGARWHSFSSIELGQLVRHTISGGGGNQGGSGGVLGRGGERWRSRPGSFMDVQLAHEPAAVRPGPQGRVGSASAGGGVRELAGGQGGLGGGAVGGHGGARVDWSAGPSVSPQSPPLKLAKQ